MDRFLKELESFRPKEKPTILDIQIDNDPFYIESEESWSESESEDDEQDLRWLEEQCERAANAGLPKEELKTVIIDLIKSDNGNEELQSLLVDVIGFDHLDFISSILSRREELRQRLHTHSQISLSKTQRELQIRENQRFRAERNANLQMAHVDPQYPHVFRKHQIGSSVSMFGHKYALPEGTERVNYATYEKVTIPYPKPDTSFHPKRLIQISELDDLCKITFSKYETLNKMQSLVYPIGYDTNENMLICAPTGAGKTDVALITILSIIKQHSVLEDGFWNVDYDNFKIVYVAPLKALAAEIVEKMGSRLAWLRIKVRELTGDMQLTRAEINDTQIIVTTPEKWDVVTRKPHDDTGLTTKIKLLIIDEVHLLHEDRGAVIESLVARTLRQVESSQSMIRIVGLSATLPNFVDVAEFLKVNPQQGLFFFDNSFRPCPLQQEFIGVRGKVGSKQALENIDQVAYDSLLENVEKGFQVMVFVHSRKDTAKTARTFRAIAQDRGELSLFLPDQDKRSKFERDMSSFKNRDMTELFDFGFGIHHAGMGRSERNLTEKMFMSGAINVLCCTATLAWGVNLPAAVVIIKGTQVYDAKHGGFVDLGISDVIQIFGRAGRPQFEKFGTGILVSTLDRLDHYLSAITHQFPIESRLQAKLADNLNAEISLGTVTNVQEAIQWLGYTYLYVRMRKAPQTYGLKLAEIKDDPRLSGHCRKLVIEAARRLQEVQMIVFDEDDPSEMLISKDIGRIASDFYLLNTSVEVFNTAIKPSSSEASVLSTLAMSGEFDGIKARQEEAKELELMEKKAHFPIKQGVETPEGKTNALIQAYISQIVAKETSLGSDMNYVAQNSTRIVRAFFLLCLSRRWGAMTMAMLDLDKSINRRMWADEHPILQFELQEPIARQIRAKNPYIEDMKDMSNKELGDLVHNVGMGKKLGQLVDKFPLVTIIDSQVRPITTRVMRVEVELVGNFSWDGRMHGKAQYFWIWVQEDTEEAELLHTDKLILDSKNVHIPQRFDFAIPIKEKAPNQLILRIVSDTWIGSESTVALSFKHLVKPESHPIQTRLLNLRPLPVTALKNQTIEQYYRRKFEFFNPMQTMCFHTLYHEKTSVLLGSPTGSGKTIACEIAIWAALRDRPGSKIVYIAPMKALVKERVSDWRRGICQAANLKLVELTGDTNPEADAIRKADIIITTPEKFDGISRNWQTRTFVQNVSLLVMDEVHLLASDRGAILEMIVSRMNFIKARTGKHVRLLGMSTAVANAGDMASWLGVKDNTGLFNFPSSVRPVPLEMYIESFPDNVGFCPLMKSMNKPAFLAIKRHSPSKPALIFVPSRRQTRLTAQDFIHMCGNEENPRRFLHMSDEELSEVLARVSDETLSLSLQFGIAIHHAGLVDEDRKISHELFEQQKVQILVATSTLAWGVNLPAYLVVIKGTQFYDAKVEKYKNMDLTDVLQMMGRAGRPAFDTTGVAMVYTKQSTKAFYKYFLNIGFPVESSLHRFMEDHIGAEISARTIKSRQEALDFLTWTFLYRRIHANPTYYDVQDVNKWMIERVDQCLIELERSSCLLLGEEFQPTPFLKIASFYYMSHKTIRMFLERIKPDLAIVDALLCLAFSTEYTELSVRHNEDMINEELSLKLPYHGNLLQMHMGYSFVKAFLLVQARMRRLEMPIMDYVQDTISVLDQAIRILQALIDTCAEKGYFDAVMTVITLLRCMKQGCEPEDNMLRILPGLWNTKSSKRLSEVTKSDSKALGVPKRLEKEFIRALERIPRPKVENDTVRLSPRGHVYCPMFHKPQVESWFVITEKDGKLLSLERVQRGRDVPKSPLGTVHIISDTLDISFTIDDNGVVSR
ncbi:Antiviral helicase SLH1 [Wickerhamiella sorbophila]|uniref:Antiviral helicase SLH1 n=1 Tax=Wickerhamiella sorbophila TaxID=45607 RepID=A0A2T0FM30_9ASCO|nr:Antiviral helicase SLH1 [Wickerhamiella sorbophila]PRT56048.1 Antiviral helicase SLH1 [Wickerhamiella sorbophila]